MQHDLFGSSHDLDLRSNFQHDLSRSNDNLFYASWREEHDVGKRKFVQSYCRKTVSEKLGYFGSFCTLEVKPLTVGQIWEYYSERALIGLSNALFRGAVALLISELCVDLLKIVDIWPTNRRNLTFNDLWWPDLWPDQKCGRSDFFLIFDALSHAAFPVSLRGPGAELEGGCSPPPRQQGVEVQTPSGARVKWILYIS